MGSKVNGRHETIPDEIQHVQIIHPREFRKHSVVQWLLGRNYCTDNEGDYLDLFLSNTRGYGPLAGW